MAVAALALLIAGVAGAIARPRGQSWPMPTAAALVAIAVGVITVDDARQALDPLVEPILFLLTAVPLAIGLDRLGVFVALARRLITTGRGAGSLWVLAALVTTLLNLDAAVVLLTPLYVHIARLTGRDPLTLAFQPVLLACLASSALPVSNLTNLIAVEVSGVGARDVLVHLGPPSLCAVAVGWWRYRRLLDPDRIVAGAGDAQALAPGRVADWRIAASLVAVVGAAFVAAPLFDVEVWIVAAIADVALIAVTRRPMIDHAPVGAALVAVSLGVLAAATVTRIDIERFVSGGATADVARIVGVSAVAANLFNNLPALLVLIESVDRAALWAVLVGVNMGPVLLITGSLASLLWIDALGRLGVTVRPRDYTRVGWRVGAPAALAAAATLVVLHALTS